MAAPLHYIAKRAYLMGAASLVLFLVSLFSYTSSATLPSTTWSPHTSNDDILDDVANQTLGVTTLRLKPVLCH